MPLRTSNTESKCYQWSSQSMEYLRATFRLKCSFSIYLLLTTTFLRLKVTALPTISAHISSQHAVVPSSPPSGLFDPIEISPAVIPYYPYPGEALPPMFPSFPKTYKPVLTGNCPVNFSSLSTIMNITASDCSLAALVGNVICCPQVYSLLHIFQGHYDSGPDIVLNKAAANDCFSDIISILTSRGANSTITSLCMIKPSNLTGGLCPIKDVVTFEKIVNTTKLLESCSTMDSLKECCRPLCQPAIMDAAFHLSSGASSLFGSPLVGENANLIDALSDCKGVVYAWLSRKLSIDAANKAFRMLSSCKVNRVCPLEFKEPKEVIKACNGLGSPNPSCCSSLNTYIAAIQKQMLITNKQAINCAFTFGSILQKGGVMANVYELCDIDLKDFSLQDAPLTGTTYGHQGCLLGSLPSDVVIDDKIGFSFNCDVSDNIAAPWPSSSTPSSLSLCAPEMSLPAMPSQKSGITGKFDIRIRYFLPILSALLFKLLQ